MSILAIDFGGTRMRAALFSNELEMLTRFETFSDVHEEPQKVIDRLIATGRKVVENVQDIDVIGVAAPGPLDASDGIIYHAKTLPGWRDIPLRDIVRDAFDGVATVLENDGNLGALAEYHMGAGNGDDPMVYLTLSTGIGGGVIIDNKLFKGASGLASEPGHMRFFLPDGTVKRLETLASGTALRARAIELLQDQELQSDLRSVDTIDGKTIGEAALDRDNVAMKVISEASTWLGLGFVNLVHLFNPRAIVLGGSLTKLGDLLLGEAVRILHQETLDPRFLFDDLVRVTELGDNVCLFGAAIYAKMSLGGIR